MAPENTAASLESFCFCFVLSRFFFFFFWGGGYFLLLFGGKQYIHIRSTALSVKLQHEADLHRFSIAILSNTQNTEIAIAGQKYVPSMESW